MVNRKALMPIVATGGHERHAGSVVDNGHCVRFLQVAAGAPHTSMWRRGDRVQDNPGLAPGTLIATFNSAGRYTNATDGSSHCAILVAQHDDGSLTVWDAWQGQPVHQRVIRNRNGNGAAANDASRFFTIELAA